MVDENPGCIEVDSPSAPWKTVAITSRRSRHTQPDHRVQVELLEKVRLDPRRDAITEQRAVRNDDRCPPAPGALQTPHDQLEEQQRRFGRAPILGEIVEDACLLLTAEGQVGQDDVDTLILADLGETEAKGIAGVDARGVQAVQQEVELGEQEQFVPVDQGPLLAADELAVALVVAPRNEAAHPLPFRREAATLVPDALDCDLLMLRVAARDSCKR